MVNWCGFGILEVVEQNRKIAYSGKTTHIIYPLAWQIGMDDRSKCRHQLLPKAILLCNISILKGR
ncbi:unnamed protein product [Citrullus colocynthis]|uniref:Uncharacterized protein n=1 Tax=Citrullus colocynthis TaxID=252529 RepID=A0ABP0YYA0_9ROSI